MERFQSSDDAAEEKEEAFSDSISLSSIFKRERRKIHNTQTDKKRS